MRPLPQVARQIGKVSDDQIPRLLATHTTGIIILRRRYLTNNVHADPSRCPIERRILRAIYFYGERHRPCKVKN